MVQAPTRLLRSVSPLLVRLPYASELAAGTMPRGAGLHGKGNEHDRDDATTQHRPNARRTMAESGPEGRRSDGESAGTLQPGTRPGPARRPATADERHRGGGHRPQP